MNFLSLPYSEKVRKHSRNQWMNYVAESKGFNYGIFALIAISAILTGVQLTTNSPEIILIQKLILYVFVLELFIRFAGRKSLKDYLSNGWNYFDIIVIGASLIPSSMLGGNADLLALLRVIRILKIFRTLRALKELRLISHVLLISLRSLTYTGFFFILFMYVYAVIGVSLFRNRLTTSGAETDPYGTLGEAFFTLFRILTGDDWATLRYNLMNATPYSNTVITLYHVSWVIISAFLLINLVVGAVINNYEKALNEYKAQSE